LASGDSKEVDLADLNPEFARRLGNFLAGAQAAGIPSHIIEAYRSNAVQAQYYADKLAGKRPYPVAAPGQSFHNYGAAADILANSGNQQQLIQYAQQHPEFGIYALPGDAPHFQMAGYKTVADLQAHPPTLQAGTAADLSPFIAANQGYSIGSGYAGGQGGTAVAANAANLPAPDAQNVSATAPPGTTLNRTNPFISALGDAESNWRNIYSQVDKDYPGQPDSRSQGFLQIDTPTWRQYATPLGIKAPDAMSASEADQIRVASQIPLSRYGSRTLGLLHKQFGDFDTSQTVGQLAQRYGGGQQAPGSSQTAQGGPSAATGSPGGGGGAAGVGGALKGSSAEKAWLAAAKTLGLDKSGQDQQDELKSVAPTLPTTGPATGGMSGPNIMGPRAAAMQTLAAQGFNNQPLPANMLPSGGIQSPVGAAPVGSATGLPSQGLGLGTTLNSPSQLQMAMMYGWPYGSQQSSQAPLLPGSY
jgi:hypothetical protein